MNNNTKLIFTLFFLLAKVIFVAANNIQISNVRITGQNTAEDFSMIEFDINWENSWRLAGGSGNWDAAWIFVKYRENAGPWKPARLNNTGHSYCAGTTMSIGLVNPGAAYDPVSNQVVGVFLYRSAPGNGMFNCTDVQLRWDYGANNIADNQAIDIRVFAIEHVYVPQGAFKAGSGGVDDGGFYTYPTSTEPFAITSEVGINVGPTNGFLYYQNPEGFSGDQLGPIPAAFPKGFNDFYMMKYEISQQAYVDFLNTLTREQQIVMVNSNISFTSVANTYVMSVTTSPSGRNGIRCRTIIPPVPGPVTFYCDLNANNNGGEAGDGLGIPSNFMLWKHLTAYLDWAGLRIMTELEFEKSARGVIAPVANEYAWGNNIIYDAQGFLNSGFQNETAIDPFANCAANYGPIRNGSFATGISDRTLAGSGYYGGMELSGNVWEWTVSVGKPEGRAYQGHHGNGELTPIGSDVPFWPGAPGSPLIGTGVRGGAYWGNIDDLQLSDRAFASNDYDPAHNYTGGRGCRTAP